MSEKLLSQVYDEAADLITPEGAWTQGTYARGASGQPVRTRRAAKCFCIMGAVNYASGYNPDIFVPENLSIIKNRVGYIDDWNDKGDRKQKDVVALLRLCAEDARSLGR